MREVVDEAVGATDDPPITVVVTRHPKPGREAEFEAFVAGITAAASAFPGHLGATIFRPGDPADREYRVVFKFDHVSNLRKWEASAERAAWYARARELAADEPTAEVLTGLEAWFTLPGRGAIVPPPRHKMATIALLGAYPLAMATTALLAPALIPLPLPVRVLVISAVSILAMTYVVMPRLTRLFAGWLYPTSHSQPGHDTMHARSRPKRGLKA